MGNITGQIGNQIVNGFYQNDENVLHKIYATVYPKVMAHILKNNGNEDHAKDVFQDAFVACWKNIKEQKFTEGNVEGYLFTIAKNKWTDYLRSSKYKNTVRNEGIIHMEPITENSDPKEMHDSNQDAMKLALNRLGDNCKNLLNHFYFERKKMNEIASELNITSASARNQKYRCMEKLRALTLEIKNNG